MMTGPGEGLDAFAVCVGASSFLPKSLVDKMLRYYILLVAGVFLFVSFAFLDGWPFRSGADSTETPDLSRRSAVTEEPEAGDVRPAEQEEPVSQKKPAKPADDERAGRIRKAQNEIGEAEEAGNDPWRLALSRTVLDRALPWSFRTTLLEDLRAANQAAIFGSEFPFAHEIVRIESGDNLTKIAWRVRKAHGGNVTPELIRRVNGLAGDMIRRGQSLRVPTGKLELRIHKRDFRLFALLDGAVFDVHPVGLGKNNSTPVGSFTITGKTKKPSWRMPDGRVVPYGHPEHTIGSRWMGFATPQGATSYGIHGTVDADSIGKSESEGCIRLLRDDVESIFELAPEGCPVTVLR